MYIVFVLVVMASILAFGAGVLILVASRLPFVSNKFPAWQGKGKKSLIGGVAGFFAGIVGMTVFPVPSDIATREGYADPEPPVATSTPKSAPTPKPTPDYGRDLDAKFIATEYVKQSLKSPSTAKFPWINDYKIFHMGKGKWKVSAYVDAQNSFGAMLRQNFTCVVQYNGGGSYTPVSLDMY